MREFKFVQKPIKKKKITEQWYIFKLILVYVNVLFASATTIVTKEKRERDFFFTIIPHTREMHRGNFLLYSMHMTITVEEKNAF